MLKNLSSWRNTHANRRSLTLIWWFTSASFLRRSSTIWSWPSQLAIYNGVWPVCTCIKIKEGTFNCNHTTQWLFTATSWFCVAVMRPKGGEEPGNGGTSLYNFFLFLTDYMEFFHVHCWVWQSWPTLHLTFVSCSTLAPACSSSSATWEWPSWQATWSAANPSCERVNDNDQCTFIVNMFSDTE